jgi:hypothetical protein
MLDAAPPAATDTPAARSAAELLQDARLRWFVSNHVENTFEYEEVRNTPFSVLRDEYELFCRACRFEPLDRVAMCAVLREFDMTFVKDAEGTWMIEGLKVIRIDLSAAVLFEEQAGASELLERCDDASTALEELALLIDEGAPTATLRRFMAKNDRLRQKLKLGKASDSVWDDADFGGS